MGATLGATKIFIKNYLNFNKCLIDLFGSSPRPIFSSSYLFKFKSIKICVEIVSKVGWDLLITAVIIPASGLFATL